VLRGGIVCGLIVTKITLPELALGGYPRLNARVHPGQTLFRQKGSHRLDLLADYAEGYRHKGY
jgi:hypothetical protein